MIEQKTPQTEILAEDTVVNTPAFLPVGEEPEEALPLPKVKRRKKRFSFGKGLSIYLFLLLAAAAVALWFFYNFLQGYEAGTPNAALERYMTWVATEDYESIFETSDFEESHLNTKSEYIRYMKALYDEAENLSVRQQVTSDESVLRYSLYSGKTKLSNIVLAHDPEGDGSSWYVNTELTYQEPFTVIASDDLRLSVNDTEIHLLQLTSKEIQSELFPVSENGQIELPKVRQYTLEGLLNPPEITALTLNGDECLVVTEEERTLRVLSPTATADQEKQEELAIEAATTYAKFVARDASMTTLLEYVYPDSQLYDTIRNFSNVWFNTHEGYEFHDIAVSEFSRYATDDFTCVVSFRPTYIFEGETVNAAPVNYRMIFLKADGEWKLCSLTQTTANKPDTDYVTGTDETVSTETN